VGAEDREAQVSHEEECQPLEPWDPGIPAEVLEVTRVACEVVDSHGDEHDLIARLVSEHGETEALRMLALGVVMQARSAFIRTSTVLAVEGEPGWGERCCPTCGTLCEECLAEVEGGLRDALSGIEGIDGAL
jgi:hypothetical protein